MNSLRSYRYRVVDVFTERPLEGNALAVFTDASGMDDGTMQKLARELNLFTKAQALNLPWRMVIVVIKANLAIGDAAIAAG